MKFQRNVYRRHAAGYEHQRRASCWQMRVPDRYPEVIVNCFCVEDVVAAVGIAREENLLISVCSGGHSWHANHLRDGALLVNLRGMSDYDVDVDAMRASAQPALRGSDLYLALKEHGLWFPTGHCTDVAIGGFLLQGGVGFNNHRTGPACGSVIAIDVVTADGQFIHARDDNAYADLLWAARGAGGGFFGVVVRYYLKLYSLKKTFSSFYIYPLQYLEEVFAFCHDLGPKTATEINMMISWDKSVDTKAPVITLGALAFTDTTSEAHDQLTVYEQCPVRAHAIAATFAQETTQDQISANGGDRHYLETKYYNGDCIWTNASITDLSPILHEISLSLTGMAHVLFTNFGSLNPAPRPPMAFSLDANYYYGVYAVWDSPAQEGERRAWLLQQMKKLEPFSTGMALADENLQDRPTRFMKDEHLTRLDKIRDAYDPEHRFVQWMGRPW